MQKAISAHPEEVRNRNIFYRNIACRRKFLRRQAMQKDFLNRHLAGVFYRKLIMRSNRVRGSADKPFPIRLKLFEIEGDTRFLDKIDEFGGKPDFF